MRSSSADNFPIISSIVIQQKKGGGIAIIRIADWSEKMFSLKERENTLLKIDN